MINIAVDIWGGDFAPEEIIEGVKLSLKEHTDIFFYLVGPLELLEKYFKDEKRVEILPTDCYFSMGEHDVLKKMRDEPNSSMVLACKLLKEKKVDGLVTAGPTQALVVTGLFVAGRIPGIKRLAIMPETPAIGGKRRYLIDSGANLEISARDMYNHAVLASEYLRLGKGIENPKVALLNVGVEKGKGRVLDNEVYDLLTNDPKINFVGNVEPKEMFTSDADIFLTDGFSGNFTMKAMEGAAKAIGKELKQVFKGFSGILAYLLVRRKLKKFKKKFDSNNIGGAILLGTDGVIIKSHGSSKRRTIAIAIDNCYTVIKNGFIKKIGERIHGN